MATVLFPNGGFSKLNEDVTDFCIAATVYKIDERQLPKLTRICAQLGGKSGLKLLIH